MLEQFQPWIDYKKMIEEQATQEKQFVNSEVKKIKTKTKPYQMPKVQALKIGRK